MLKRMLDDLDKAKVETGENLRYMVLRWVVRGDTEED